ncbi:MAG: hypothetical protein GEV12_01180 [Micromonosporaceae bacterium]|nr:hypothetical protein [Micromonosporaceae bacterium]
MRSSWMLAAMAAGLLAVAGCGGDSGDEDGDGGGTASPEQTCAAVEQAMTELGAGLQTALTEWDGSPENVAEISSAADRWGGELRDLAAESSDGELRGLLEDLATAVVEFGAGWGDGGAEPNLDDVETALQPLEDRCGFGAGAGAGAALGSGPAGPSGSAEVCAAALGEADGGSFDQVATAAEDVDEVLAGDDQAALEAAIARLRDAADRFAQGFRDLAAGAEDAELRAALEGIAAAVETWVDSFAAGSQPDDLSAFQEAVTTLGARCD